MAKIEILMSLGYLVAKKNLLNYAKNTLKNILPFLKIDSIGDSIGDQKLIGEENLKTLAQMYT